ncbi:MAG: helix-turn-helix domain-containing protein [Salinivirgaceae bacterium]
MTEKQTEQKILDAARKLFMRKGMHGAKMQEIADEAGINKALLHYYFRSKDKLFDRIFQEVFGQLFPKLQILSNTEMAIEDRVQVFVNEYMSVMQQNPFLPLFILHEIQRDPDSLHERFTSTGLQPDFLLQTMSASLQMTVDDAKMFIVNLLALCIFPFAAKPLLSRILFKGDESAYDIFLEQRKTAVPELINKALRNQ